MILKEEENTYVFDIGTRKILIQLRQKVQKFSQNCYFIMNMILSMLDFCNWENDIFLFIFNLGYNMIL